MVVVYDLVKKKGVDLFRVSLEGKTYEVKDKIKSVGFSWDSRDKIWYKTLTKAEYQSYELGKILEQIKNAFGKLEKELRTNKSDDKIIESWNAEAQGRDPDPRIGRNNPDCAIFSAKEENE